MIVTLNFGQKLMERLMVLDTRDVTVIFESEDDIESDYSIMKIDIPDNVKAILIKEYLDDSNIHYSIQEIFNNEINTTFEKLLSVYDENGNENREEFEINKKELENEFYCHLANILMEGYKTKTHNN